MGNSDGKNSGSGKRAGREKTAGKLLMYRELEFRGTAGALAKLGKRLEAQLPSTWTRDRRRERSLRARDGDTWLTFTPEGSGAQLFILILPKERRAYVPNIVPVKCGVQLTVREWNEIMEAFVRDGARAAAEGLGLTLTMTEAERAITDWLSWEAARLLDKFSFASNRSTGSAHWCDAERFNAFIIQAHRDGCRIDAGLLADFLEEVDGWGAEHAQALAAEYQSGRDLLHAYDRFRPDEVYVPPSRALAAPSGGGREQ